jgi:hypothetical protein
MCSGGLGWHFLGKLGLEPTESTFMVCVNTYSVHLLSTPTRPRNKMIGVGLAVGVAIGAGLGVALNNIPLGVGLVVAVGTLLGLVLSKRGR